MVKKGTPQLSEEEMIKIYEDFKASGLSRRQFCIKNSYPSSNFYYWQNKYFEKYPEEKEALKGKRISMVKPDKAPAVTGTLKAVKKVSAKSRKSRAGAKKTVVAPSMAPTPAKKPGRPPKQAEGEAISSIVRDTLPTGPVIQIKYPNGIKITVPSDIDLKRLKKLLHL